MGVNLLGNFFYVTLEWILHNVKKNRKMLMDIDQYKVLKGVFY